MAQGSTFLARIASVLGTFLVLAMPGLAFADDYADVSRLLRAGQHTEALAKADQYLAAKPRDPQMRFIKGVIQTETGRTSEAMSTFARLTEEFPELPEPYNNLAVLYAGQNQFDKARAALEMAIRTNPSYATAHENLGDVYARLAIQSYNKTAQLAPANTTVQAKVGLIRQALEPGARNARAKPAAQSQSQSQQQSQPQSQPQSPPQSTSR